MSPAIDRARGGANNPSGRNQHTETDEVNRNNVTVDQQPSKNDGPPRGNTTGYAIRRLAKHRPDLLAKVESGELTAHRLVAPLARSGSSMAKIPPLSSGTR